MRRIRIAVSAALALTLVLVFSNMGGTTEFERAVLNRLTPTQIITYLNAVDQGQPAVTLGAKYLWGAVPLDREPPSYLGDWWTNLSVAEQEEHKVKWFKEHVNAHDLDEVGRYVDLSALISETQVNYHPATGARVVPWWVAERDTVAAEPALPPAPRPRPRPRPAPAPAPVSEPAPAALPQPAPMEPVITPPPPADVPPITDNRFLPITLRNEQ